MLYLLLLAIAGLGVSTFLFRLYDRSPGMEMDRYIKRNQDENALYLVPPQFDHFRLAAAAPILVDKKSHPFKDDEVLEWYERLQISESYYAASAEQRCPILDEISERYHVNHVLLAKTERLETVGGGMENVYSDAHYSLYSLE